MVFETRRNAPPAEAALRTIGAVHPANLLQEAIPSHEQFADAFYDTCGRLSQEIEDLPLLICDYARANRDALLGATDRHSVTKTVLPNNALKLSARRPCARMAVARRR
jgi:hypothetical protein